MITGVSTRSINQALQRSIQMLQRELVTRQHETQTGSFADIGISLGEKSASYVSFLKDVGRLESILDGNKIASTRLVATQDSLNNIRTATQSMISVLTAGIHTESSRKIAAETAKSNIEAITTTLNTTVAGQHVFAGLNTDAAPVFAGYGIPAGNEMDAAFIASFGFTKTDPAAAAITPAAFQAFVTAQIEPMFMGAGWNTIVSSASDESIRSRISLNEVSITSISANEPGMRAAVFAGALAANFLPSALNNSVADQIAKTSISQSATAQSLITEAQSRAGFIQERISQASSRLTVQRDLFQSTADDLTAVDPFEAASRMNALLTQIETSYALTQKIQNLSILRYLG